MKKLLALALVFVSLFSSATAEITKEYLESLTYEELLDLKILVDTVILENRPDDVKWFYVLATRPPQEESKESSFFAKSTPRPIATPRPTATPLPDYAAMKIEDAARLICESASDGVCILRSIEIDPEVIFIDAEFGSAYKDQSRLIGAVRYTIRIAQEIFAHKDAPMIYLRFHENGRDQYGNQVDMTTITIRLKRETAAKMNLPYMLDSAARTQKLFLDAADGYSLHKDYKEILK